MFTISILVSFANNLPNNVYINSLNKNSFNKNLLLVHAVPVSSSFSVDGCQITITTTVIFVFDDQTFQLIAVGLSGNYFIEIDCGGGGMFFTRTASDFSFEVENGRISNIQIATTGNNNLDKIYVSEEFRKSLKNIIEANNPFLMEE